MGLFIARISGGALGALFALFAFALHALIRRAKLSDAWVRILSAAGALGGACIIIATVRNLLRYAAGISSVITVSAPFLAFAIALTTHFLIILSTAPNPRVWRLPYSGLAVAILSSLQLALALFNLIRNWNNLTRGGMKEYLYLQLLALAFIIIDVMLFWIIFGKARNFVKTAATN